MTEAEWLSCTNPKEMLAFLQLRISDRKLRLFAVACCRRSWQQLTNEALRLGIETAEQFADGLVNQSYRSRVDAAAYRCLSRVRTYPPCIAHAASLCCRDNIKNWINEIWFESLGGPMRQHSSSAALLREVLGNPFRPVRTLPPSVCVWNDGTVPKIAESIYEQGKFEELPILADALEDAGCADAGLLDHLRVPESHVRGCWALDLVLGKE
jgi:hypothetical protein